MTNWFPDEDSDPNLVEHISPIKQLLDIKEIYRKSIIDWNEFYEARMVLMVRTANNTSVINKMPFHEFTSNIKFLNKYIESENKSKNGENPEEQSHTDAMNNMKQQSSNMMKDAKNNFKAPKLK